MVSLLYVLCLITVVPLPVVAEVAWGSWHGGAATSPYYGCYGYRCPYYAGTASVICLTAGYGYAPNYGGYGYPYVYGRYVRCFYAAVRGVRHARNRSATASTSSEVTTTQGQSLPSKTVQAAPADPASPRNVWTPMTVPISPSSANETPKTNVDSAEWAKKFELRLNQLSPDMWAASALLEQEGFRVDSGSKSSTGWFLTAHDKNQRRGGIRLQSDGTKIVLTVTS